MFACRWNPNKMLREQLVEVICLVSASGPRKWVVSCSLIRTGRGKFALRYPVLTKCSPRSTASMAGRSSRFASSLRTNPFAPLPKAAVRRSASLRGKLCSVTSITDREPRLV